MQFTLSIVIPPYSNTEWLFVCALRVIVSGSFAPIRYARGTLNVTTIQTNASNLRIWNHCNKSTSLKRSSQQLIAPQSNLVQVRRTIYRSIPYSDIVGSQQLTSRNSLFMNYKQVLVYVFDIVQDHFQLRGCIAPPYWIFLHNFHILYVTETEENL